MNEHRSYLDSDESSQTSTLFGCIGYSLMGRRIQNMWTPEYLRDLFRLRDNIKNLRGVNKLQVLKPNTTRYGRKSVKYLAAITWNKISDTLRYLNSVSFWKSNLSAKVLTYSQ